MAETSPTDQRLRGKTASPATRTGILGAIQSALLDVELHHLMVFLGILLGVFIRADYTFSADFPLNDGGLFYQMARDLQANGLRLPATTPYNFDVIPFAYPPLGFYLAALLDWLTPLSLVDVFRFLPLAVTSVTVLAMYRLARDVLTSKIEVVVAVFAFALVPRSFIWLLMGGGITRSLGLLFAMLALHQIYLMYRTREWRYAMTSSVLAALTILSHIQTGSFLAFSSALFFVSYGLHRRGLIHSAVVGIAVVVLTAPYWGSVIAMHGLQPFLSANQTGGSILTSDAGLRAYLIESLLRLGTLSEPLFPLIGTLGFLGVLACITSKRFMLPAWWAAIILLDARAFPTFSTVPVAMLAGIGLVEVILPIAVRPLGNRWAPDPEDLDEDALRFAGVSSTAAMRSWAPVILAIFLWYATNGALMRAGETPSLVALSPSERDAMTWVSQQTPKDSSFLIITTEAWPTDKTSEWFPVLADRRSVATPQGYEWMPGNTFERRVWMHDQANGCADADATCVVQWRATTGVSYDYVMVPKPPYGQCCERLLKSLKLDSSFRPVYDGPGATIYQYLRY
ncbi:MAG: hypothetical protein WCL53_02260 [Chloroflexota bacterium]